MKITELTKLYTQFFEILKTRGKIYAEIYFQNRISERKEYLKSFNKKFDSRYENLYLTYEKFKDLFLFDEDIEDSQIKLDIGETIKIGHSWTEFDSCGSREMLEYTLEIPTFIFEMSEKDFELYIEENKKDI